MFEFANRFAESALEFADLRRHQLRKAQQQRGGNTAARQVLNDFLQVGGSWISFGRAHDEVAFAIYVKVPSSPVFDPVGFDYLFDRGGQLGVSRYASWISKNPRKPAWLQISGQKCGDSWGGTLSRKM